LNNVYPLHFCLKNSWHWGFQILQFWTIILKKSFKHDSLSFKKYFGVVFGFNFSCEFKVNSATFCNLNWEHILKNYLKQTLEGDYSWKFMENVRRIVSTARSRSDSGSGPCNPQPAYYVFLNELAYTSIHTWRTSSNDIVWLTVHRFERNIRHCTDEEQVEILSTHYNCPRICTETCNILCKYITPHSKRTPTK
jgi:hypothetical protein